MTAPDFAMEVLIENYDLNDEFEVVGIDAVVQVEFAEIDGQFLFEYFALFLPSQAYFLPYVRPGKA